MSASDGKSDKDARTSHRTTEDDQGKDPKRSLWAKIFGKKKKSNFNKKKRSILYVIRG